MIYFISNHNMDQWDVWETKCFFINSKKCCLFHGLFVDEVNLFSQTIKLICNLDGYAAWAANGRQSITHCTSFNLLLFSQLVSLKKKCHDLNFCWSYNLNMIEFSGTSVCLIFFAITYLQEGRYAGRYTRQKGMNDSTFAQFVSILITKTAPTKVSTQAVGAIIHAAKQWIIPFGSSRTLSFSSSRSLALTFSPSFAFAHFESVKWWSVKWLKDLYEINLCQTELGISLNYS